MKKRLRDLEKGIKREPVKKEPIRYDRFRRFIGSASFRHFLDDQFTYLIFPVNHLPSLLKIPVRPRIKILTVLQNLPRLNHPSHRTHLAHLILPTHLAKAPATLVLVSCFFIEILKLVIKLPPLDLRSQHNLFLMKNFSRLR